MPVHVSIHDVSPAWSDEVEAALRMCHEHGLRPALLVVPDFHGRAPLRESPRFCARLRELQADAHEVYLHGFFHQSGETYRPLASASASKTSEGGSDSSRLAWFVSQRVLSGGEAEMSDVSAEEGRRRIDRGEQVLRDAGLRVDGFVAPAWSNPRWLLPLLRERGCRYTEDHVRVYDPAAGRARTSVVLNWASRSAARLLSTVAWCRAAKHAGALLPARIAIHPADMHFLLLRREILRCLAWARDDAVARGADLLA